MSALRERSDQLARTNAERAPIALPRRLLRMRSDATLAERFAAGDETAFDVLYERHRQVVLAVCMGVLGSAADAEDATQETFSALAVALGTRPPAELRPWLIRVARNASIDTTRRRRHRLLTLDGELPEVPASAPSAGKAELAVVLDGIRELPESQRIALLMRELGGHSYAEIAEFLETDAEAVKGLIARARVGLRSHREAAEMSCASARSRIETEPDGRRYDRTVRRHLRGCGACRSYRAALRDDARTLRAALPIQAGGVATGGISSGALTAVKGSLLGYGLTQAAATCAASACAVGAIGGIVLVAPVRTLGLPPILPALSATAVHRPAVHRRALHEVTGRSLTPTRAVTVKIAERAGEAGGADHAAVLRKPASATARVRRGHRHLAVTRAIQPPPPRRHPGAPGPRAGGLLGPGPGAVAAARADGGAGATSLPAPHPATAPGGRLPAAARSAPAAAAAPGASAHGVGHRSANGARDHGHGGGPVGSVANASGAAAAGRGHGRAPAPVGGAVTSTTAPAAVGAPVSTTPGTLPAQGPGQGRGWGQQQAAGAPGQAGTTPGQSGQP